MDKYIGKLLDNRYEILQVIGTGGMAVVYKALCHRLNRLVAIKILKDEFSQDEEFRNRFHTESQAVAMLSHPNIVAVYDVSRSNSGEYIVMELIDGITLKQYMERRGTMNWKEAQHFVSQILSALQHAHSKGIIHRDIKPHNIMVLRDGTIKVTDFGIARFAAEQGTLTNEALGSVHYISPEQARGGRLDARADIYSTGVMLYEMITGSLPYEGETPVSIAIQHINSMPLSPRDINPEIPETIEKITMKAMCGNVDRRYASAAEMLSDLESFRRNPKIEIDFSVIDTPVEVVENKESKPIKPKKIIEDDWVDDEPESKLKKHSSKLIIAGVAALFLIGLYALFSASFGWGGGDTKTPNLIGIDIEEVMSSREYSSFTIKETAREYSKEYPEGEIIKQYPEAGKSIKKNGEISVSVSRGAKEVTIPDVTNMTEKQAKIELETRLGLNVRVQFEASETILAEYVIRTSPAANSEAHEGDNITVYISKGTENEKVKVPELIGLTEKAAKMAIEEAKLTVGEIKTAESDAKKGTVIAQSVEMDSEVDEKTEIDLTVSAGKAQEEPPVEENPNEDEPPVEEEPQAKVKTIPIKLPSSPDSFTLSVKLNGKEVYKKTHNASEGTATVSIEGSGVSTVEIYIDGKLFNEISVNFG